SGRRPWPTTSSRAIGSRWSISSACRSRLHASAWRDDARGPEIDALVRRLSGPRRGFNAVDCRYPVDNPTERCVDAIKRRGRPRADEERRGRAPGIVAPSPRAHALHMLGIVEFRWQVVDQLLLPLGQRPLTRRERTGLNHESWRDTVKRHRVVHPGIGKPEELPHRFDRLLRKELDRNGSGAGVEHNSIFREIV